MRLTTPIVVALAAGCGVNEKNWPDRYAAAWCDFAHRCAELDFFYEYQNERECREEYLEYWEDSGEQVYRNCDFDDVSAAQCLDALDLSCRDAANDFEDFSSVCQEVWVCD